MSGLKMVCIGTAAQDVFLMGEVFTPQCEEGICYEHLKLGDKLSVENMVFATGGNAMNASVTFARQGLETSFISVVGKDPAAAAILSDLDAESIHSQYVVSDPKYATSYSVVLLAPNGERTILNCHGEPLSSIAETVSSSALRGDWLYVSSLGSFDMLKSVIVTARKNGMKVAFNPASFELASPQECADLFSQVDLLALNKEEAQTFADGDSTAELAKQLCESVQTVLVSDGPRGAVAADGKSVYSAGMYEDVAVIDRTGAGDAFTSGFVCMIAQGKSVEEALIFASANSTSVVTQIGAKAGILHKGAELHDMDVVQTPIA
ncbi:carbohydrate kinase family protein [Candidatus Saccharibacteria bacterium]|nr:carbohydrate kinase family protein [Candidatus Saccharibacteria bacterium]